MKKIALTLIVMAGMLLGASPAFATEELDCTTTANYPSYTAGKRAGIALVDSAWRASGRLPNRYEAFKTTVRSAVRSAIRNTAADGISDAAKCRAKGLVSGVRFQLDTIQDEVAGVCLVDGTYWGTLSGDIYCALALAFGTVELFELDATPVTASTVCAESFEGGCTEAFDDYAVATCVEFTDAIEDACYVNEYLSWVGGMCVYEVE